MAQEVPPGTRIAPLTMQCWSTERWLASQASWEALQRGSASDALFLSWDWLTQWWHTFGPRLGRTDVRAFYRGERLVGFAPLYRRTLRRAVLVPTHSVQVMGLAWRETRPLISEYLDVIAPAAEIDAVRNACVCNLLEEGDWSEFVIGLSDCTGKWHAGFAGAPQLYARDLDRSTSYHADLTAGFAAYLRDLHQSTRRSVWNLRRRLAQYGDVRCEFAGAADIPQGFLDLNRLHKLRWHRSAFSGERLAFHEQLAMRAAQRDELRLSRLHVGGRVVSVLYDLRKGSRQYNIKMAFDPGFSARLSLGLLHLGYAMEAAAAEGSTQYDFLAGPGQRSDFKRLLSQHRSPLSCLQVLRGRLLPPLFRWRDRVRQR